MSRTTGLIGALAACMLMSGCLDIPDFRAGETLRNPFARTAPPTSGPVVGAPLGVPLTGPAPAADVAERACTAAGADAGFDVRGIVGTHEVPGADGRPESRDVMLRVQRNGRTLDVRCSYAYAAATARMMTL